MSERPFHQDVEDLTGRVGRMADLSRLSVHEGVDAFVAGDIDKARRVLARNEEINRADVDIEARSLDLIALHQPMAVDLRTVGACLKIITYLDRVGRYGYDTAKATIQLEGREPLRDPVGITVMRDKALKLLDEAVTAFRTRDAAMARKVQPADDELDALYEEVLRASVTRMVEEPRDIMVYTQKILVARHLERVGDNAGKIAEKTIYMVTGERRLSPVTASPSG